MIVVDLCQVNYQILLITYLKLIIKIAKHAWKEKNFKSECEFIGLKNNRLNYKCKECSRTSNKAVNDLIEKFPRMHKFCNGDLDKFVLLLRKGVYPYPFYSELNLEGISDKYYANEQKV